MNEQSEKFVTKEEFDKMSPQKQGYITYVQANDPRSPLKDENPYHPGTPEHEQFDKGALTAMVFELALGNKE